MNTIVWIIQGILAALFAMAGLVKSTRPREKLLPRLPWVADFSMPTVRLVGISELLGAIGLIVPLATGICPILTPVAAAALGLVMLLAAAYHARKKEYKGIAVNAVLFGLTMWVACYRFMQLRP